MVRAERTMMLDALRAGAYHGVKNQIVLPSSGELSATLRERFTHISGRSQYFRATIKRIRMMLGGAVKRLPAPIRAELRRIF
jgi:hypothetical protein